ncbi:MAG: MerR family DNA-binding transcriptional regulator [Planctomycetes bacterium]|nr:MerR family DNA-binding transcriptional regulator [Planctomycetota bacterium]
MNGFMPSATLAIGQMARAAGVNRETLGFHGRRRLLPRPPRTPSGHRAFPAEALGVVRSVSDEEIPMRTLPLPLLPAVRSREERA